MNKIYIAYGSNMDMAQMEHRCPGAQLIGTGDLPDYKMLFKGSKTGSYSTVEPDEGNSVPVYVWSITPEDEDSLDIYEGYPTFYYKTDVRVIMHTDGEEITGMAYIMHEDRPLGFPHRWYYQMLMAVYEEHCWDQKVLEDAIDATDDAIWRKYNRR